MKRPSIRRRLILGTASMSALLLMPVGIWLYFSVQKSLEDHFDQLLDEAASLVMIEIEAKNSEVYHEWHDALLENEHQSEQTLIQVWDQNTEKSVRSPALGQSNLERKHGALGERVFYHLTLPDGRRGRAVGILTLPINEHPESNPDFIPEDHPQIFVWAQSGEELHQILYKTKQAFLIGGLALIILLASMIWLIVGRLLQPIQKISDELTERKGNEIGQPLEISQEIPIEIIGMTKTFNLLLQRIDHSRSKDRDFFLNVAHEVRTPIAGLNAVLEQALRAPRSREDYQKRISEALSIGETLGQLVNRLLEFGSLRNAQETIHVKPFSLNQIIQTSWKLVRPRIEQKSLIAQWDLCPGGAPLESNAELAQVVILNLVENAVNYSTPESSIVIKSAQSREGITFTIRNTVTGDLPSEQNIQLFFEPFYRQDKARGREDGHAGLGLSFSREVLEILSGEIRVQRHGETDLQFIVFFPHLNKKDSPKTPPPPPTSSYKPVLEPHTPPSSANDPSSTAYRVKPPPLPLTTPPTSPARSCSHPSSD